MSAALFGSGMDSILDDLQASRLCIMLLCNHVVATLMM